MKACETVGKSSRSCGAGKEINGRKRHLVLVARHQSHAAAYIKALPPGNG
ncbi:hypothetical protein ABR737_27710 [Streptomyces sp. Edi2]